MSKAFGPNLGSAERPLVLFQMVKDLVPRPTLNILEVGSYRGYSALLWRAAIGSYNASNGMVVCVDPWKPYLSQTNKMGSEACREMDAQIASGSALQSFLDNTRDEDSPIPILPLVGTMVDAVKILPANFFDLIYIDGDHKYSAVVRDIQFARGLLKADGLLCGDDLEIQYSDLSSEGREHARAYADTIDYTVDPASGGWFHPGVTTAVVDCLGQVENQGNQWWIPATKILLPLGA